MRPWCGVVVQRVEEEKCRYDRRLSEIQGRLDRELSALDEAYQKKLSCYAHSNRRLNRRILELQGNIRYVLRPTAHAWMLLPWWAGG